MVQRYPFEFRAAEPRPDWLSSHFKLIYNLHTYFLCHIWDNIVLILPHAQWVSLLGFYRPIYILHIHAQTIGILPHGRGLADDGT